MKKITTKFEMTVPFFDLDPMNVVWHGNYIKYLEEARCDFFKKINYSYFEIKKDGILYPIAKLEIKYIKSAYFGEELEIITTLKEIEPAVIFQYKIVDKNTKEIKCKAETMQMGVDDLTGETIYVPHKNFIRKINEYKD